MMPFYLPADYDWDLDPFGVGHVVTASRPLAPEERLLVKATRAATDTLHGVGGVQEGRRGS